MEMKARSGAPRIGFEGGQMPLYRRIPKRGFKNRNHKEIVAINVSALERFEDGTTVDVNTLLETGIIKDVKDGVKILGNGEFTKKLNVKAGAFRCNAYNTEKRIQNQRDQKQNLIYLCHAGCDPDRVTTACAGCAR